MYVDNITPSLEIRLFGSPSLTLNGKTLDGLRRKNRALVFYLAAQTHPLTRDDVLACFWPDQERSTSQPILRTMIHDLRKQLGDSFLVENDSLALTPDTKIDVQLFSALLHNPTTDSKKLNDALALYKGDFVSGFSVTDAPHFDDWAAAERERYRLMAARGFVDLSRAHEAQREYPSALEASRRALAFNPFQEDIQRDVMRLLYLNGDRAGVIRQYEALRNLLDEEMGVPPMPETRNLYDALINDTFVSAPVAVSVQTSASIPETTKPTLPFIGRESELETLKRSLDSGKLILLEGEPGIGKTRLVSELIASQTQTKKSVVVLKGVAYELEQTLPYQPIVDALRGLFSRPEWKSIASQLDLEPIWLAELARLLPELLTYFPHLPAPVQFVDESRLWESLLQFFRALSRQSTVWLFIDDLHWADTSTVGWLGYFIRHISALPCNVLATVRPISEQTNLTKLLHALRRNDQLAHLPVSELPASAMQKIAVAFNPAQNQLLSNWLVENAEGNPFFITEIIRYAFEVGLLKTDGTLDAELFKTSPILPPTIQNLIESRIMRLSETARHILHLAAVIGREFDLELVQRVAGETEVKTLDAIEELQAAQLIRTLAGGTFAFDHSLTMQVTLKDMSDARRFAHHRQVGETLESIYHDNLDAVSGLIAHHFAEGNLPARAASYAFHAGQSAAMLAAWVEAIAFYEQAISLEREDAKRIPIYLAMSVAHFHKGDFSLSAEDCRPAIQLSRANADWQMLESACYQFITTLRPQARYLEIIALAKEMIEIDPPELAICAELILGAGLAQESAHPLEAEQHLREAERLLNQQTGYSGPVTLPLIIYELASVMGQQGRELEAIVLYRKALDLLAQGKGTLDLIRNILIYNNLAYQLHLIGDPSAKDYAKKGIRFAHEKGSLSHIPYLYSTSGEIALANHELDAAETSFRDGLVLAEKIPLPEMIAGLNANLGLVAKERGDSTLAHAQLKNALTLAEQLGNRHLEVRVRIWLAPLQPPEEALPSLDVAHTLAAQGGLGSLLEEIIGLQKSLSNPL